MPKSAGRKSVAATTAASARKARNSSPPKRFVAGGKNPPSTPIAKARGRGRPKANTTVATPRKGRGRVATAKIVKPKGKSATLAQPGRPAKGSSSSASSKGPKPVKVYNDELDNTGLEYQVEKIKDSRIINNKIQYLVKWVGYPESQNTWEPEPNVRNAQDAITAFDVEFPEKEYPDPLAPVAVEKKALTPAPESESESENPKAEQAALVAAMN